MDPAAISVTSWATISTSNCAATWTFWRVIGPVDKALVWLEYQDMNECGLLEVPEAADWMDLLAVRYNVLYDNALWSRPSWPTRNWRAPCPQARPCICPMWAQ
ncbi:MAG: hypothetical protein R3A10_23830 [Caldilineaceae bacterium]